MSNGLTTRLIPLGNVTLSMDDVVRLYGILRDRLAEAAEIELRAYVKPDDMPDEEFEEHKRLVRELCYRIQVVIAGRGGERIVQDDETIFHSQNLPGHIASIFMTSMASYRAFNNNRNPRNGFEITLDFSKPPLLDWQNPVSAPTPNSSNLNIVDDDAWVRSVAHSVLERLSAHKNKRRLLHKPFIYDLVLLLLGIPAAFFAVHRASPLISDIFVNSHSVIQGAAYVYIFLLVLLLYRLLFSYAKWAFPTVELMYRENAPRKHRVVLGTLTLGILATTIYDLIIR